MPDPTARAAQTECCNALVDGRFCPRCGWECRILPPASAAEREQHAKVEQAKQRLLVINTERIEDHEHEAMIDALIVAVRQETAPAPDQRARQDVAWLIERYNGPVLVYWTGRRQCALEFESDASWAVRFSRFDDAEQVRIHVAKDGAHCRSVEHVWFAPPATAPKTENPT